MVGRFCTFYILLKKPIRKSGVFMPLLSSSSSITRYRVEGEEKNISSEFIRENLQKNRFPEIEDPAALLTSGWTPFESHYLSEFSVYPISFGTFILFCLRMDKKSIPSKILKKHISLETQKRLKETGKNFLGKNEKKSLKEDVEASLLLRIPATPNLYDVMWNVEEKELWFFSGQKAANEELETLFARSFACSLIRIFPYTFAFNHNELTDHEKDLFTGLSPVRFSE